ncbi:Glyoxylase, beta-lactamase superfamily II [Arachidicoccus rhizosphaerae]|jgi:glyoxylase-like metal-dependent hydrolase (beta-lactamase superfamily II)|uniref:Glyoxylase, beta-lactamase superfamily II n=1 Tax=Arachidicoccus rhizosphaerae TaxID=551991 RepID=A0A1H4C637_9BACT|nr:MBL fold metallo-hydrolase [Arachidicoccus rhizosphaerae]SEA55838.1 Glyoxylase, beta-lactamase superfamily II [Arachidicoccus rhizosphaerae]
MEHIKINIGQLTGYIIYDGYKYMEDLQPIFAPEEDRKEVEEGLKLAGGLGRSVKLDLNVLYLEKGDRKILLDAGAGDYFGPSAGRLLQNLKAVGVSPDQITDIVITHIHKDHTGGIFNQAGKLNFPEASFYVGKEELEFWQQPEPDFSKSKRKTGSEVSISNAKNFTKEISGRLNTYEDGDRLFGCLEVILAPGHTPGHCVFRIFDGRKSLIHTVDAFHIPALVSFAAWGTQFDTDFELGKQTRARLIAEGAAERTIYLSCHLPFPGAGRVILDGRLYKWEPLVVEKQVPNNGKVATDISKKGTPDKIDVLYV